MDQSIDFMRFVLAFRRHIILFIAVVVVFSPAGLALSYLLPTTFTSQAKILIESQRIPDSLAQSTIVSTPEERLSLIEQRILSRTNILDVAARLDFFAGEGELSPTERVDIIKDATQFRNIRINTSSRLTQVSAFEIAVSYKNPFLAARLANEFVTMAIEQNVEARSSTATETHNFFREEAERLSGMILRLEEEISLFKSENTLALPEGIDALRQELLFLQERFLERENRRLRLNRERDRYDSLLAAGNVGDPDGQPSAIQRELETLVAQLATARALYTDQHPQIRMLVSRIDSIENEIASSGTSTNSGAAGSGDGGGAGADETPLRSELDLAVASIDAELRVLDEQDTQAQERIERLEKAIEDSPRVGMTLSAFERRYEDLQQQYQEAYQKRAEAAIGERLEVNRQAERFEVIEQAEIPEEPDSAPRLLLTAGGIAGALGLGFMLVIGLELMNTAIRTAEDLKRTVDLHPIVVVPYISTPAETKRRRWAFRAVVAGILILTPIAIFAFDQFVMPLPLLIERVMDRFGLSGVGDALANMF